LPERDEPGDLALLTDTVRQAGAIARRYFEGSVKSWSKKGGSPVSEADLAVDHYLREHLRAARPVYGWLSEETPDDPARLKAPHVFVVDPIDGTIAFLKRRPHFTVCAAVVAAGRPVAGVVYNPMTDEMFAAQAGGGAFRNGKPIQVSRRGGLEGSAMLGNRDSFSRAPWPPLHVQNRNSVALRLAMVAEGAADAAVSLTAKCDWDLAAADIIVSEAGGRISDRQGSPLLYNQVRPVQPTLIAAGPLLHGEILALLRQ
jgi:myo-inositol-1(or 4)-monophosphatase